jgi:hypothetical protein
MGLIRGEGFFLKQKYIKKYGDTQEEAINRIDKFITQININKAKMKAAGKSESEIKDKIQKKWDEEWQKLDD